MSHPLPHFSLLHDLCPALVLLLAGFVTLGWIDLRPVGGDLPVVAVFAPWQGRAATWQAAVQAGARLVAPSPLPFAVMVQSPAPGFFARLRAAGAWIILDATARGTCRNGPPTP